MPEGAGNRQFRCPQCKMGIALTADSRALGSGQLQQSQSGAVCPICQCPIGGEEFVVTCPACDQIHHRECWAEIGGCGTYGCQQAPSAEKAAPAEQPRSAWGDTKYCPVCGEMIKAIAVRCRYCHAEFDTVDPLTIHDLRRKGKKQEAARGLRNLVLVLFILSLIGCLAPILLPVNLVALAPRREAIAKAGPLMLVLAYAAIIVSLLYSLMLIVGLLVSVL